MRSFLQEIVFLTRSLCHIILAPVPDGENASNHNLNCGGLMQSRPLDSSAILESGCRRGVGEYDMITQDANAQ